MVLFRGEVQGNNRRVSYHLVSYHFFVFLSPDFEGCNRLKQKSGALRAHVLYDATALLLESIFIFLTARALGELKL